MNINSVFRALCSAAAVAAATASGGYYDEDDDDDGTTVLSVIDSLMFMLMPMPHLKRHPSHLTASPMSQLLLIVIRNRNIHQAAFCLTSSFQFAMRDGLVSNYIIAFCN